MYVRVREWIGWVLVRRWRRLCGEVVRGFIVAGLVLFRGYGQDLSGLSSGSETRSGGQSLALDTARMPDSVNMLPPIVIADVHAKDPEEQRAFYLLMRDVQRVYPYVYMAVRLYQAIEDSLARTTSERQRKRYLRKLEKALREHLEKPLKNLTVRQGKVLVLLISRELGISVYALLRRYKSGLSARYWQTIGSFLGYDLKVLYDTAMYPRVEFVVRAVAQNFYWYQKDYYDALIESYLREVPLEEVLRRRAHVRGKAPKKGKTKRGKRAKGREKIEGWSSGMEDIR